MLGGNMGHKKKSKCNRENPDKELQVPRRVWDSWREMILTIKWRKYCEGPYQSVLKIWTLYYVDKCFSKSFLWQNNFHKMLHQKTKALEMV